MTPGPVSITLAKKKSERGRRLKRDFFRLKSIIRSMSAAILAIVMGLGIVYRNRIKGFCDQNHPSFGE
jgi:hypothetical protein